MKEGWIYKKLGEVATYINGFPFKPSDWGLNGKPIIRIQNLTNPQNNYNRCTRTDIPEKYFVKKGDVLISWSATLGIFEWNLEDALLNQHIFKVVFDKIDIDKQYFKYAVNISISEMAKHTNGATMKHIRKGDFDNIKIPFPPLSEQKSIVSRLDSAFAKIDALKANAKKQLDDAKALFQKALEKAMEPKEGWEEKKLKDVAKYRRGSFPQPYGNKEWYDGENSMPFVQVAELQEDSFNLIPITKRRISKIAQPLSVFVPAGTVLVTLQGSIGKVAITDYDSYVDRTIAIFQDYKIKIDKLFFAYQLKIRFEIERLKARGTTIKTITKEEFANFTINCPPLSEQQAIVSRLDQLSENVKRLQEIQDKTIKECDALKQAILREVFE